MDTVTDLIIIAVVVIFAVLLIKLLTKPIRFVFKLLINTALGYIALFILNFFGSALGFSIDITLLNAVITGILGVPGVILILVFKFLL